MFLSRRHIFLTSTLLLSALSLSCNPSRTVTDSAGNQATVTQKGDSTEISVEQADGSSAQIAVGEGEVALPENLPKDLPIFAEAAVMSAAESPEGMALVLKTTAAPEKIIEFYEAQLQSNDWQVTTRVEMPQGLLLTANKESVRNLGVLISGEAEADGASLITLTLETSEG